MRVSRAPSITLAFAEVTQWEIMLALDEVAEHFQLTNSDPVEWHFPQSQCWRVKAHFDEDALASYSEDEKALVHAEVGPPAAVITLTLHLNVINDAVDAARTLVLHLLGKFHGVVDDRSGKDSIWTIDQVRNTKCGIEFLHCYRQK